ncbi:MAG TPA: hypothetical protein PL070_13135, partial [Flavobacteriales bacterium]|nr:hypothetical protein [Flavobacteriales bacterium]
MRKLFTLQSVAVLAVFCFFGLPSFAQVSITATGSTSQNFSALSTSGTGSWTNNSTIANWYWERTGAGNINVADGG